MEQCQCIHSCITCKHKIGINQNFGIYFLKRKQKKEEKKRKLGGTPPLSFQMFVWCLYQGQNQEENMNVTYVLTAVLFHCVVFRQTTTLHSSCFNGLSSNCMDSAVLSSKTCPTAQLSFWIINFIRSTAFAHALDGLKFMCSVIVTARLWGQVDASIPAASKAYKNKNFLWWVCWQIILLQLCNCFPHFFLSFLFSADQDVQKSTSHCISCMCQHCDIDKLSKQC